MCFKSALENACIGVNEDYLTENFQKLSFCICHNYRSYTDFYDIDTMALLIRSVGINVKTKVNTVEKGNKLEDKLHTYLCEQQSRENFVYGLYPPNLCEIYKKKKYPCKTREAPVEFDVVIEFSREGSDSPHLYVVFECKNHAGSISEIYVNDFTSKLRDVFQHAAKGVMVISSRLQSGAEKTARNRNLGIVKYDEHGLDIIAERRGGIRAESGYVKSQIISEERPAKSLKFSAYYDGKFFGSIDQFLANYDPKLSVDNEYKNCKTGIQVPFISRDEIQQYAQIILEQIEYQSGPVDLGRICSFLSIDLAFTEKNVQDADGNTILGAANFDNKSIQINFHENKHRERFTISHEIGHFCLHHDRYLRAETIAERDLLINDEEDNRFNYERLEFQANAFASDLLLPEKTFMTRIVELRINLGIRDRGHGYIFVDDQTCNRVIYENLLLHLSSEFEASKLAIEIKLKKMGLLIDHRERKFQ